MDQEGRGDKDEEGEDREFAGESGRVHKIEKERERLQERKKRGRERKRTKETPREGEDERDEKEGEETLREREKRFLPLAR